MPKIAVRDLENLEAVFVATDERMFRKYLLPLWYDQLPDYDSKVAALQLGRSRVVVRKTVEGDHEKCNCKNMYFYKALTADVMNHVLGHCDFAPQFIITPISCRGLHNWYFDTETPDVTGADVYWAWKMNSIITIKNEAYLYPPHWTELKNDICTPSLLPAARTAWQESKLPLSDSFFLVPVINNLVHVPQIKPSRESWIHDIFSHRVVVLIKSGSAKIFDYQGIKSPASDELCLRYKFTEIITTSATFECELEQCAPLPLVSTRTDQNIMVTDLYSWKGISLVDLNFAQRRIMLKRFVRNYSKNNQLTMQRRQRGAFSNVCFKRSANGTVGRLGPTFEYGLHLQFKYIVISLSEEGWQQIIYDGKLQFLDLQIKKIFLSSLGTNNCHKTKINSKHCKIWCVRKCTNGILCLDRYVSLYSALKNTSIHTILPDDRTGGPRVEATDLHTPLL